MDQKDNRRESLCPSVFYVGGHYIQDARGTHMTGQMCVRRYGRKVLGKPAVVFVHGAAQTGTHWEETADGRPGFALIQADGGWECFVVDQPGIGRSRYHAEDLCELTHYTTEELEAAFTSPRYTSELPWAKLHTQWPGSGKRGDPIFDAWYASQVGHIKDYSLVEKLFRPAINALLEKVGPAFLVTHSQSGPLGWHAADICPHLVCGIVALEPHGPPFTYPDCAPFNSRPETIGQLIHAYGITSRPLTYEPPLPSDATVLPFKSPLEKIGKTGLPLGARQEAPVRKLKNVSQVPVLLITAEASYHSIYDHLTVEFLREAGVDVEHVYLANEGIHGNGHMMAIEKNSNELQIFISRWFEKQILVKGNELQ